MANPYSLIFGKEPANIINSTQYTEIVESLLADSREYQVCMLTGVRGAGKTVMLTAISNEIKSEKDWIVVNINPERDMLNALAAELGNRYELLQIFRDAKINLSFLGFGLEIDNIPPITDVVIALDRMLNNLTKKGKKVLITVDEVTSNVYVKQFVSQYQMFVRENYNVYLLMTGLYENIYELQNEKSLTFLYRAPKVELKPLNLKMVARNYAKVFDLCSEDAMEMAAVTKGYPYAYQLLGYLCYKYDARYEEILDEFEMYLEDYVYEKIWSELSEKDQLILIAMSKADSTKVEAIRDQISMDSNNFTVYRKRLLKKGVIVVSSYGHLEFSLPRFKEFVLRNSQY